MVTVFTIMYYVLFMIAAFRIECKHLFHTGETMDEYEKLYAVKIQLKAWDQNGRIGPKPAYVADSKETAANTLVTLGYMFLCFAGVLTSQWLPFLIIMALSFGIPDRWRVGNNFANKADAVLTLGLVLVILVNKFHVHYQWKNLFTPLFSLF